MGVINWASRKLYKLNLFNYYKTDSKNYHNIDISFTYILIIMLIIIIPTYAYFHINNPAKEYQPFVNPDLENICTNYLLTNCDCTAAMDCIINRTKTDIFRFSTFVRDNITYDSCGGIDIKHDGSAQYICYAYGSELLYKTIGKLVPALGGIFTILILIFKGIVSCIKNTNWYKNKSGSSIFDVTNTTPTRYLRVTAESMPQPTSSIRIRTPPRTHSSLKVKPYLITPLQLMKKGHYISKSNDSFVIGNDIGLNICDSDDKIL